MPWWVILRSVAFKAKRQDIKFDLQTTSTLAKCRAILQQLVLRSRKLWDVGPGKLNDVLGPQHVTRLLQAHVLSGAWVENRVFHIHHAQKNGFLNSTVQAGIWTSWSWCTRNRKIKSNFLSTSKVGWRNVTASYIISFDHLQVRQLSFEISYPQSEMSNKECCCWCVLQLWTAYRSGKTNGLIVCVVLPDRNKVYKNKWIKLETVGRENMNMTWPFKQVTQGDQVEVQNLQLLQALSLKFPKQLKHHRAPTDPPKLLWSFRPMGDLAYIEQKYWPHVGCFVTLPPGPALEEQCNNKAIRFVGVASITSICLRSGTYILCKLDLFIEFPGPAFPWISRPSDFNSDLAKDCTMICDMQYANIIYNLYNMI